MKVDFEDPNLNALWRRYKSRNFPLSLSIDEQEKWARHRESYLIEHADAYVERLHILAIEHQDNPEKIEILEKLGHYLAFLSNS